MLSVFGPFVTGLSKCLTVDPATVQASASRFRNSPPTQSFAIGGSFIPGNIVDNSSVRLLTIICSDNCRKGGGGRVSILNLYFYNP